MSDVRRRLLTVALGIAVITVIAAYRESFASIVNVWRTNSTFSHGILILPISAWLAWRKRDELAHTELEPSWWGASAVLCLAALWVVARGAGVIGLEHFAIVAMVPALVLALLGPRATRVLIFPLSYLIFAVPIGHALVPMLMQATADVATWALQATGIPVYRTNMYISIPAGKFEVARACSGLNYLGTGLALGALYSWLTYSTWRKRLLSMAAFVVIPVVANGLRVYFTILVSQFTDMRFGPGQEHVWFGRAFFILVMLVMFWFGRRWHDEDAPPLRGSPTRRDPSPSALRWVVVPFVFIVIVAGPLYLASATRRVEAALSLEVDRLRLPTAPPGWSGPIDDPRTWQPLYSGARAQRSSVYRDASGVGVDAYVGVYGIGTTGGTEMISYGNRIFSEERIILAEERDRVMQLPGGQTFSVREQSVRDEAGEHLVWYWYMVGSRHFTDPYRVKAQEGLAFLTRDTVTERVVTLSTLIDGNERRRLEQFVRANADCVTAGFAIEACAS